MKAHGQMLFPFENRYFVLPASHVRLIVSERLKDTHRANESFPKEVLGPVSPQVLTEDLVWYKLLNFLLQDFYDNLAQAALSGMNFFF